MLRARDSKMLRFFFSSKRILDGEYYDLNYFDKDGSRVARHVQNQVLNMIAINNVIEEGEHLYTIVNKRLRDLLLRAGRKFLLTMHRKIKWRKSGFFSNKFY